MIEHEQTVVTKQLLIKTTNYFNCKTSLPKRQNI